MRWMSFWKDAPRPNGRDLDREDSEKRGRLLRIGNQRVSGSSHGRPINPWRIEEVQALHRHCARRAPIATRDPMAPIEINVRAVVSCHCFAIGTTPAPAIGRDLVVA